MKSLTSILVPWEDIIITPSKPKVTIGVSLLFFELLILKVLLNANHPAERLCFNNIPELSFRTPAEDEVSIEVSFTDDLEGTETYAHNRKMLREILEDVSEISGIIQKTVRQRIEAQP